MCLRLETDSTWADRCVRATICLGEDSHNRLWSDFFFFFKYVHGKVNGQDDAGPDGVYVGCSTQKPRCDLGSVDKTGNGPVAGTQKEPKKRSFQFRVRWC